LQLLDLFTVFKGGAGSGSFGLQRHVTSYIRVVHYMSMFSWADQLNYKYKKPLNFIMCILKKGDSNSASNS